MGRLLRSKPSDRGVLNLHTWVLIRHFLSLDLPLDMAERAPDAGLTLLPVPVHLEGEIPLAGSWQNAEKGPTSTTQKARPWSTITGRFQALSSSKAP